MEALKKFLKFTFFISLGAFVAFTFLKPPLPGIGGVNAIRSALNLIDVQAIADPWASMIRQKKKPTARYVAHLIDIRHHSGLAVCMTCIILKL